MVSAICAACSAVIVSPLSSTRFRRASFARLIACE
jgi:hypothetical protein